MAGRQAKILHEQQINDLLVFASATRNPLRNKLIVLLSVKAGLRAAEIAGLTWAWCSIRPARSDTPSSCTTASPKRTVAAVFR
jgi:integrase